jgi:ABC-type antimicrobial peptide transport system permease subunit
MLFAGFSFFLIASAAMLTALLFRLGVELRSSEIGLLLATGYTPRSVSRLLLAEGMAVSAMGTIAGLGIAAGYAWLMLAGLRSWWSAAAHAPFLSLHVTGKTLSIGLVSTLAVALASLAASVGGLTRRPPRALLAGEASDVAAMRSCRSIRAMILALISMFVAVILLGYAARSAIVDAGERGIDNLAPGVFDELDVIGPRHFAQRNGI